MAALLALLMTSAPANAADRCAGAHARHGKKPAKVHRAVMCLVNAERRERGLAPLRGQKRLRTAARRHSRDMTRRRYFDHISPDGRSMVDRARRVHYVTARASWRLAENIAWGMASRATPAATVRSWMRSPGHRSNILDAGMREAGVGVALRTPSGDARGATYTMLFGRRG